MFSQHIEVGATRGKSHRTAPKVLGSRWYMAAGILSIDQPDRIRSHGTKPIAPSTTALSPAMIPATVTYLPGRWRTVKCGATNGGKPWMLKKIKPFCKAKVSLRTSNVSLVLEMDMLDDDASFNLTIYRTVPTKTRSPAVRYLIHL